MITQNPIIGHSKNKIGNVYCRVQYGKNVVQTRPGKRTSPMAPAQAASATAFGLLSKLANQIPASDLNQIYYSRPTDRSRRSEWLKQLAPGMQKVNGVWKYNPANITNLGSNKVVTKQAYVFTPITSNFRISKSLLNSTTNADETKVPCLVLICVDTNQCISLVPWTTLDGDFIAFWDLSPTFLNHECYIFPLWQTNVGTLLNPVYAYGAFSIS